MAMRYSVLGCVLVSLACAACSGAGEANPALVARARAELKSDNAFVRRRAALFLALNGQHTDEVVGSVVTRGEISFLAISLLGKAALPRVSHHLASGDEEEMRQALRALSAVGEIEPKCIESLRDAARKRPDDKRLQQTSLLLSAIAAPGESERKALLDQLAPPASDGILSAPELYLVAVSFPPTRDWGMGLLRKRLARLREAMKAKDWNQDENPEFNELFAALYFGLPIAAREGQLAPADLTAFREVLSAVRSDGGLGPLGIRLTEWLAKSEDTNLLDAALKEVGDDTNADHTRTGMICVFGDFVLRSRHIPPLIERASQPKADPQLLVGAIRLLASAGAADERVPRFLRGCLGSDSAKVRQEAEGALGWCVDKRAFDVPREGKARSDTRHAEDDRGNGPLARAAAEGDRDRAEALLAKGAAVNARNSKDGATPLHRAARLGHQAVAELLLAKGANVSARDIDGKTPLHQAASKGVAELLLAKGADVNARDRHNRTPLHEAVGWGQKEVVEVLLAKGARVDAADTFLGETPLHQCGRPEIAALLLAKGAKLDAKDKLGGTPLHTAAGHGNKRMVEFLLAQGADVNATDNQGTTPLDGAIRWGHKEAVEVLLAKGANVNAKARDGITPLHTATGTGKKELAALLLAKGADPNAKTPEGMAPVHAAILGKHEDLAAWLLTQGASLDIAAAAGLGLQKELVAFLDADPKRLEATVDGHTPLAWAAMRGKKSTVEFLLARGANVNAKDETGMTPLVWATSGGHKEVAEILRQHGGKE